MQVHVIGSARSRQDTVLIGAHVPVEVAHRLHALAAEEETTVEALLLQAIRLLIGEMDPDADIT